MRKKTPTKSVPKGYEYVGGKEVGAAVEDDMAEAITVEEAM